MLKMIEPSFRRTVIVLFEYDNELKQSKDEVYSLLKTTSEKLGTRINPFFVAILKHHGPKDGGMLSSENFVSQTYKLHNVMRGIRAFNGNGSHIGLSCLKNHLKSEIDNIYRKNVALATLALLQPRCAEVSEKLVRLDIKKQVMSAIGIGDALCSFFLYTFGITNRM